MDYEHKLVLKDLQSEINSTSSTKKLDCCGSSGAIQSSEITAKILNTFVSKTIFLNNTL